MENKDILIPYDDRDGVHFNIDIVNWPDVCCYAPETTGWLAVYDEAIHVGFTSAERPLKETVKEHFELVFKDSCCEFFIMPFPEKDKRYLNFEINSLGTLYLGCGTCREDGGVYKTDPAQFRIVTHTEGKGVWSLAYKIPFSFLKEVYGEDIKPGQKMLGNFYKCADNDANSHYLTHFPINWEQPDFHRPEFFGNITIGK